MSVLKWIGLSLAVAGLGAAALMGFGSSSYAFNSDPATSCGSILLPKNRDDALCNDIRSDNVTWLVTAVVVAVAGVAIYLIARRLSIRSAGSRRREAAVSV
jgi:hypothetical protein